MSAANKAPAAGSTSDRPVRFEDPERNAAYWARIDRIVDQAPPLNDSQRAVIRTAFSQTEIRRAA